MTMLPPFPQPLESRFSALIAGLVSRLRKVEARTAVLDTGVLVCNRTGVIPGSYTSGDPTVVLAGQTAATGPYPCLSGYTPAAGATVLLAPLGQSYVILGTYS